MNNNNIGITSSESFQEVIENVKKIRNNMADIFGKEKINAEKINGSTNTWIGKTQTVVYEKHKQLSDGYDKVLETMDIYIRFMQKALDDYMALDQKITKDAQNNATALNVNS